MGILFLLLILAGGCQAVYKRWLPNTNFGNPNNWNAKRAPCGNDRVLIPTAGVVVYLQANTTLQELILPLDGEVLFGTDTILSFTSTPDTSGNCPSFEGDNTFEVTSPQPWVDPNNWCSSGAEEGNCQPTPLLDSEKLPCVSDDVIFPRYSSYWVSLGSNMNLTVKSLKISGSSFSTSTWQNYVTSADGRRMFPPEPQNPATVTVTGARCNDMGGCSCGTDQGEVFNQLCKLRQCPRARCNSPIKPTGSCCDMCGGFLTGKAGQGFNMTEFSILIQNGFPVSNGAQMAISKTSSNNIQVVYADTMGNTSISLAEQAYNSIQSDIQKGGHQYALNSIELQVSSGGTPVTAAPHTGENLGAGSITGIVIGVIIFAVVCLLLAAVFVRHRRGQKLIPFDMGDFRGSLPKLSTLRRPASTGDQLEMSEDGFSNPVYNEATFQSDLNPVEMSPLPTLQSYNESSGFDNPLYGKPEKNLFHNPTKTNEPSDTVAGRESNT